MFFQSYFINLTLNKRDHCLAILKSTASKEECTLIKVGIVKFKQAKNLNTGESSGEKIGKNYV